jgi:hypothetical protein
MPDKIPAMLRKRYGPLQALAAERMLVTAAPSHDESREAAGNDAKDPEPLKRLANGH